MVKKINHRKVTIIITLCLFFSLSAQTRKTTNIKATYYHDKFENRYTSSGEKFSQKLYTAAHKTLPFHTIVKVTNPKTSRSVLVKINDRCARAGVLDLSKTAAKRVDLLLMGVCNVKMEIMPENYRLIWEQQGDMFAMFDSVNMAVEQQICYMDSLYNSLNDKYIFDSIYNIKIATLSNMEEVESILSTIPDKYKKQSRYEKVYNENFYDILIGPFATREIAAMNLTKLRRRYDSAHIIKDKKR